MKAKTIVRFILITFLSSLPISYTNAQAAAKEYQIKSAFLYNFSLFITWPETAFNNEEAPFEICVLGDDPFQENLPLAIKNQKAKKRSLISKTINQLNEITNKNCHILFISSSEEDNLNTVFAATKNYSILTVSDIEGFSEACGMIELYTDENKVRLKIAPAGLESAGLKADANLLKLSKIMQNSSNCPPK